MTLAETVEFGALANDSTASTSTAEDDAGDWSQRRRMMRRRLVGVAASLPLLRDVVAARRESRAASAVRRRAERTTHEAEQRVEEARAVADAAQQLVDRAEAERAELEAERDNIERLMRKHAALWADAVTRDDASAGSPLETLFADGAFSYARFEAERNDLLDPLNPLGLGDKVRSRVEAEAGIARFGRAPVAGPPPPGVAFATVCTDKFCPGLEAMIVSLLEVYPSFDSDVWVYHDDGLTEFSKQRLLDFYPSFRFADRDASKYAAAASGDSHNQQRIGALGYLTIEALLLDQYERVVILDSDLLVVGDISALWADIERSDVRVVADAGALPLITRSELTGRPVFNSGVISLPSNLLGEQSYRSAIELLPEMPDVTCPMLVDFADQKFWNVFVARHEATYLPTNYNANKQLLDRFLPLNRGDASIIHYTNAKPWFRFASGELVSADERKRSRDDERAYANTFGMWHDTYRRLAGRLRLSQFDAAMGEHLDSLSGTGAGRDVVLIGNGPSLARSDLTVFDDHIRVAFNWFVNHEEFDDVAVDHLMVMSHMFFGGWHTVDPQFPEGFLDALLSHTHRPTLWFPFYFQHLIEATPELADHDVRYLLLEKPFKQFVEQLGYVRTDLRDHLSDGRTGVLTAGVPLALHLGCREIVLVGCDASYGRAGDGDYFYAASAHTSKSTNEESLHNAWGDGGAAHACYAAAVRETQRLGVGFVDATLDGYLTAVPKRQIPGLRRDGSSPASGHDSSSPARRET